VAQRNAEGETGNRLWLASEIVSGIEVRDSSVAALLLGLVNAIVRPVAIASTLPLTIMTLGFFLPVINAAMLGLVAWTFDGLSVAGFWSAMFGSSVVSTTGYIASWFIGPCGHVEVMFVHRRADSPDWRVADNY
jgi:putative membrane protein